MSPREKVHSRSVEERLDEMTSIIQAQDEQIRHMQVLIRLMQAHKSGKSAKEMQKRTRTLIKLASMKKLKAMETPAAIPWGHSATSTPPHGLTPDLGPKSISADVSASLSDDEGEADDAGTVLSWVRGIFDVLDAHHSGYLNRDELENARRQLLPFFGEDSEMARLLKRIEDDFQTALSWDEFVAVIHDPDAEISKNRETSKMDSGYLYLKTLTEHLFTWHCRVACCGLAQCVFPWLAYQCLSSLYFQSSCSTPTEQILMISATTSAECITYCTSFPS